MQASSRIGIDLGGTNIRAAVLNNGSIYHLHSKRINARESSENILQQVYSVVDPLYNSDIASIGIGVPGLVDEKEQMVYDVVNIPAWNKISLQEILEQKYKCPVFIDNDANCFAFGEYLFGKGKGYSSMAGITLGTGLGCGLIINEKIYSGRNGGAGEFGMMPYLGHTYEYFASGQFFRNKYNIDGEEVFINAGNGDKVSLEMYKEFGEHLANAILAIQFAIDPELIVIGGALKNAFPFYSDSMYQQLKTFPYQQAVHHLTIEISSLENAAILGASTLYLNH